MEGVVPRSIRLRSEIRPYLIIIITAEENMQNVPEKVFFNDLEGSPGSPV